MGIRISTYAWGGKGVHKHSSHKKGLGLLLDVSYPFQLIYRNEVEITLPMLQASRREPKLLIRVTWPVFIQVGRGRAGVWRKVTWFAHDSSSHSKNQKDENGYFCSIKEHTVSVWIGIPCDGQASILLNECHHERTAASWLLTWKRCHQPPQRFNIGLAVKS